MHLAVTTALRLQSASGLAAGLCLLVYVGRALLRVIGKRSAARKLHGQFVLGWMIAGWLAGSCIGIAMLDRNPHIGEADIGCAGAGLMAGWLLGMIHGAIILVRQRLQKTSCPPAAISRAD